MLATQGNETIVSRGVSAQGTGRHHGLAAPALEQDGPSHPLIKVYVRRDFR